MSQISPPLRILIIGSVVFLAAWFAFLRPGGGDAGAPASQPATQPAASNPNGPAANTPMGQAVQNAHAAADNAGAASAAAAGETAPATSAPATSAPSTSAATAQAPSSAPKAGADAKADPSKLALPLPVAKAIAADKILVMLFWNPKAADDQAVRKAIRKVDDYRGRVVVKVANIKDIARYAPITQGVDVTQSPSVVVVRHGKKADLLTGYVDRVTIEQSVSDAIRAR